MEIKVFGIPRSGTTLIYNICKDIFGEGNVDTGHTYIIPYDIVIIPLRDFRDCIVSTSLLGNRKFSLYTLFRMIFWHKLALRQLRKYERSSKKIIWLRYDRFVDDFDYVFDKLKEELKIEIPHLLREEIKKKYNIKEMKKISDKLKTFDKVDEETMIHGNHINNGKSGYWNDMIPKKYHTMLYFMLRRELIDYGFPRYLEYVVQTGFRKKKVN